MMVMHISSLSTEQATEYMPPTEALKGKMSSRAQLDI